MTQRTLYFLAALCVAAGLGAVPRIQAQDTSSVAPKQATPTSSQNVQGSPVQPAAKKVWTNEDVTNLRDPSTVPTSNETLARPPKPEGESETVSQADVAHFHDQIVKLEAQLALLDQRIKALQDGIDGKPTGNGKDSTRKFGARGGDWRIEESQLQARRDRIAARISALQDEARHKRVSPNAIP